MKARRQKMESDAASGSSTGGEASTRGTAPEAPSAAEERLIERLGHAWTEPTLLRRALTHRSAAQEQGGRDNERLEFLGDAVLGLVTARWLLRRFPEEREGVLARHKSFLVSRQSLATWARTLDLAAALRLGVGEDRSGGSDKPGVLADTCEAVLGALFLDGGLGAVETVLEALLEQQLARQPELAHQDVKTQLQEFLQARGEGLPEYRLLAASGPDHAKTYEVECRALGSAKVASGSSKKTAERRAALALLDELRVVRGA